MADELKIYRRERGVDIPVGAANIVVQNTKGALFGPAGTHTTPFVTVQDSFPSLVGSIISDQDGTLLIEFSPDGETVTYPVSIPVSGGVATIDSAVCIKRSDPYVRFTYTNGAVGQTSFTLTLYGGL